MGPSRSAGMERARSGRVPGGQRCVATVPASGQERVEPGLQVWEESLWEMHAVGSGNPNGPTGPVSKPGGPLTKRGPSLSLPLLSTQAWPLLL